MRITLNEDESSEYLVLQDKYDNVIGALLAEAEKAIARDAEIASLKTTIQQLEATVEDKARIIEIQDATASIPVGDSSRVFRDSALAKDISAPEKKEAPPWMQPKEPVLKKGTHWTKGQTETLKEYITKTGIYSDKKYRTLSWLATHFNRTESSVQNKVYTLFNNSRGIRNGVIVPLYNAIVPLYNTKDLINE